MIRVHVSRHSRFRRLLSNPLSRSRERVGVRVKGPAMQGE